MQRFLAAELSFRARLAYVGLLLLASAMAVAVGSLLLTEPALPARTTIGFLAIVAIALCWVAYATWVLRRRRVLLAGHRIVAARMAVVFCSLFVAGALALGWWGPPARAPFAAAALGGAMLGCALVLLVRARRRFALLLARRRELERLLARTPAS
jgi:hypothetical protein